MMFVLVAAAVLTPTATACTTVGYEELTIDEPSDGVAPAAPVVISSEIWRAYSAPDDCGLQSGFSILLERPELERGDYGYRLEISGDFPTTTPFSAPMMPWDYNDDDQLFVSWNDGTDYSPPIDATVTIYAVDRGGDESAPVEVTLSHDGVDFSADGEDTGLADTEKRSCGTPLDAGAVWLLALVGLARRRREGWR